ncbi:MAG: hypothetical protein ABIN23_07305 [candidate division WOR-3 bacterium]
MKRKDLFFKIICVLFITSFLRCKICSLDWPTHLRNPDLVFLAGDTLSYSVYCVEPVVSPDGKTVYYIKGGGPYGGRWGLDYYDPASIYAIDSDGKNERLILEGKYRHLAISFDGKKLGFCGPGNLILVLNLKTLKIDSFKIPTGRVIDIEFSPDTNWLYFAVYFNTYSKLFRLNLSDSSIEELPITGVWGFDIFKNGEIYIDSVVYSPEINPANERYVINPSEPFFDSEAIMRDLSTKKLIYFEEDAFKPYCSPFLGCHAWVGCIYWFPDGNSVVFSASRPTDPGGEPPQLWILKNVFKHIKK